MQKLEIPDYVIKHMSEVDEKTDKKDLRALGKFFIKRAKETGDESYTETVLWITDNWDLFIELKDLSR